MSAETRLSLRRREGRLSARAVADLTGALAARFGNALATSEAVRRQHGHTLTWIETAPPDAVVFAETRRGCHRRGAHLRRP